MVKQRKNKELSNTGDVRVFGKFILCKFGKFPCKRHANSPVALPRESHGQSDWCRQSIEPQGSDMTAGPSTTYISSKKMFIKNSSSRKALSLFRKKLLKYTKYDSIVQCKMHRLGNKMIRLETTGSF